MQHETGGAQKFLVQKEYRISKTFRIGLFAIYIMIENTKKGEKKEKVNSTGGDIGVISE